MEPALTVPPPGPERMTVIIPTYMRIQVLWRSVEAVLAQLRPGDELLVVDQNVPPLDPPGSLEGAPLRMIRMDRPSLTRARNAGIAHARNPLLVFLDDDIVPDAELVASLRRAAREHPGCMITGVVDQEDRPDDVPTPGTVDRDSGAIRTNFSRPLSGEVPFFPGGLNLIPRSALHGAPWFNPDFRGACQGEEIDFCLRAGERGARIVADPRVRILHLKVVEGGCRAPSFRSRFFLDHVFNQALFFGRHGRLLSLATFLRRLKGFVGFHSRAPAGGHQVLLAARALWLLAEGLAKGILPRL